MGISSDTQLPLIITNAKHQLSTLMRCRLYLLKFPKTQYSPLLLQPLTFTLSGQVRVLNHSRVVRKKITQPIKATEVLECIILEVHRSKTVLKFKAVSNSPCHLRRLQSQAFS